MRGRNLGWILLLALPWLYAATQSSLVNFPELTVPGSTDILWIENSVAPYTSYKIQAQNLLKRSSACEVALGTPGAADPLQDTYDQPGACGNVSGFDQTITAVACYADAGSPTVTPILSGGTATSIVTGPVTCGNAQWVSGTVNGAPVLHSFSANGATCSSTPCDLSGNITAANSAKYIVMRFTLAGR